jgi:glycosyltransferase involved in cell wall biosynthesis
MRVTIDATSALLRSAGIKSYTYHWVRHLRRLAQADRIDAFPYLKDFGRLDHEASTLGPWQTYLRLALLYFVNAPGNPALDWILAGSDIFHSSNQVRRAPRRVKLTATVHDLTCWLMPELHTPANVRADRSFAEKILCRADGLIAVSENTRQDAIRILKIAPERIRTIYSGIPQEYFDARPTPRKRPYVLYVGTIEPRKNLETLLDAWQQVRSELRHAFNLVIAGPLGWSAENTLARIRSEATYLGYVPEDDLPGLFAGATVFVYPSLYEGFGFPVAQAMAARVAVLTSDSSCLPEVTAGGAVLVDPRSAGGLAQGLTQLLESESLRQQLAAKGRRRAEQFRWEACAAQSLDLFRRIAGRF